MPKKHTHETESELVMHLACDSCGSSDANALYDDEHLFCFSCGKYTPPKVDSKPTGGPFKGQGRDKTSPSRKVRGTKLLEGEFASLPKRRITEETCRKFGYQIAKFKGKPVHVAPYRTIQGGRQQKLRHPNKDFTVIGDKGKPQLFGQHLWKGGRRLIITEGELDAMSISQVQGHKWPVVSIPTGAKGAAKAIRNNIEFIDGFDEVVFCFDMDEAGQEAIDDCVALVENGKAFVVQLPLKDANKMLVERKEKDLISCLWQAQAYRMDGIVGISDIKEKALQRIEEGMPWPWPAMTKITKGRHRGRVYTFGAGTGVGKTDVMTQMIEHTLDISDDKVGAIYLEQPPAESARRVAGKIDRKKYHDPECEYKDEDLAATLDTMEGRFYFYDHFGGIEYEAIKKAIRSLVIDCGCDHIVLDHLTALASEEEDERKALDSIMADLSMLAKAYNIYLYVISHLATPEGTPHEEGGRVMLRHFRGSRAIGIWTHYAFGLERNQQHSDINTRHTTIIRCLKDRILGSGTGETLAVNFDDETGYLHECSVPESIIEKEKGKGASDYGFDTDDNDDY